MIHLFSGCRVHLKRSISFVASTVGELAASTTVKDPVTVNGWVLRSQKFGKMLFVRLYDGLSPSNIQVIVPRNVCKSLAVGSAVRIDGRWKPSQGSEQMMELEASSIQILASDDKPIYEENSPDVLREQVHLRVKHPGFSALLRMRSLLFSHLHSFYQKNGFIYIDAPALTSNDCEGAGETFSVQASKANFFGSEKHMYLSVSGQLHLEAMANGLSRVYSFGNIFRADIQQFSRTHMSEFRMLEVEVAFCDSLDEICSMVEECIQSAVEFVRVHQIELHLIKSFQKEKNDSFCDEWLFNSKPFPRIRYSDALKILEQHGQASKNAGLSKTNELFLVSHFRSPVFITHFPTEAKPFYMKRTSDGLTESFDLLMPIAGEVVGGSVREENSQLIAEGNPDKEHLNWYSEIRRRGKPISAGFGIGFDRLVQSLTGVNNIRDTIPFPRMVKIKNKYALVQLLTDEAKCKLQPLNIYREIMQLISEMHGDLGFSKSARLIVKVADNDIFVVRTPKDGADVTLSALPFLRSVKGVRVVCNTLFVGRSIRSLEKRLITIRRKELAGRLSHCKSLYEKRKLLEALKSVTGRIKFDQTESSDEEDTP
ncbi:unnamed protein product, partial [Mesorhabditis belari]|uniref:asparagine--tRNA ligase n=1 Tax=Mesorhabditis belari TaxID=2138241 RepID=A0AAF3E8X7_9BILA